MFASRCHACFNGEGPAKTQTQILTNSTNFSSSSIQRFPDVATTVQGDPMPACMRYALMSSSHLLRGLARVRTPRAAQSSCGSQSTALWDHLCWHCCTTFPAHRHCFLRHNVTQSSKFTFCSCDDTIFVVRFRNSGHASRLGPSSLLLLVDQPPSLLAVDVSRTRRFAPRIMRNIFLCVARKRFCCSDFNVHDSHPYRAVAVTVAVKSRSLLFSA